MTKLPCIQVVLATFQALCQHVDQLPPLCISEIVVDEGDVGTVRTPAATEFSWYRILEHFQRANVVLLSATRNRRDRIPLPPPCFSFTYDDALNARQVKSLRFIAFKFEHLAITDPSSDARKVTRKTFSQASPKELRACGRNIDNARRLLIAALYVLVSHRRNTRVPWVLHVVSPSASKRIQSLLEVATQAAGQVTCPLSNLPLRAVALWAEQPPARQLEAKQSLDSFQWYVKVIRSSRALTISTATWY